MKNFPIPQPEAPLNSEEAHERALIAACRAAFQILESRGVERAADLEEEPLPESTVALLKRLPRR